MEVVGIRRNEVFCWKVKIWDLKGFEVTVEVEDSTVALKTKIQIIVILLKMWERERVCLYINVDFVGSVETVGTQRDWRVVFFSLKWL